MDHLVLVQIEDAFLFSGIEDGMDVFLGYRSPFRQKAKKLLKSLGQSTVQEITAPPSTFPDSDDPLCL